MDSFYLIPVIPEVAQLFTAFYSWEKLRDEVTCLKAQAGSPAQPFILPSSPPPLTPEEEPALGVWENQLFLEHM